MTTVVKAIAQLPLEEATMASLDFIAAAEFVRNYPRWETERIERTTQLLRNTANELIRHEYTASQKAAVAVEFNRQCAKITQHVKDSRVHYHLARSACELYVMHPTEQLLQSLQQAARTLRRPYDLG